MPQLSGKISKITLTFAVLLLWQPKTEAAGSERTQIFESATLANTKAISGLPNQKYILNLPSPSFNSESALIAQNVTQSDPRLLETIERYNYDETIYQLNSVERLQDVSPEDWAYEALRSLVVRYSCLAGYKNFTYRGNRTLSRYEFAASLNSCLDRLESLIVRSENVLREDIEMLLRLQQDFQAELAVLQGRTDGLQARTTELELTQFSTTTKLLGEAILATGGVLSSEGDESFVFGDRLRLELVTSFGGRDLLFSRLSAANFPTLTEQTGTFEGNLAFAQPGTNELNLEVLFYTFGLGDRTNIIIGTTGIAADDLADTVNFLDGDGASGAISAFGTRNPIYFPQVMQA